MSFNDTNSIEGTTIYNPTKLVFGKNCNRTIGKHLKEANLRKALVVIGLGHVKRNGLLDVILEGLRSNGIGYVVLEGVTPNPEIRKVREGAELIRKNSCDCVVPVGGGSVIDASKGMAIAYDLEDPWDFYRGRHQPRSALPIYASLTISATGTEMNCFTVVSNGKEGLKLGAGSPLLYPKMSFLDPTYQAGLSKYETTNGTVDAIIHATEFILASKDGHSELTNLNMNGSYIRSLIECRDELEKDFEAYEPRANLCLAATMCLNGMSGFSLNGGCWMTHNIQHSIGAVFHKCSHGAGLGVVLPSWLRFCERTGKRNIGAIRRWVKETFNGKIDPADLKKASEEWKNMLRRWGHPTNLREYLEASGYEDDAEESEHDETIEKLVKSYMTYQHEMQLDDLSEKEIREIFEGCW